MRVDVYTQPDCAPCEHMCEYMARKGIQPNIYDINSNIHAENYLQTRGVHMTPFTVVYLDDGTELTSFEGFDPLFIDRIVKLGV